MIKCTVAKFSFKGIINIMSHIDCSVTIWRETLVPLKFGKIDDWPKIHQIFTIQIFTHLYPYRKNKTALFTLLFTTLWQPCYNLVNTVFMTLYQPYHKVVTRLLQGYEKNEMKFSHMAWLSLMGSLVLGGGHMHLYTQDLS